MIAPSSLQNLPPAPRPVTRQRSVFRVLIPRLFILPFAAVALFCLVAAIVIFAWALVGQDDTGSITGKHISYGRKQTSPTYVVEGAWDDHQRHPRRLTASVSQGFYESLGDDPAAQRRPLDVRVLRIGSFVYVNALPEGQSPWKLVAFISIFAIVWNLVSWLGVYGVYVEPYRRRKLIRWGQATEGRVTRCEPTRNAIACHYTYEAQGMVYQDKVYISKKDSGGVAAGTPLTIFFDPRKPSRSVVLEHSEYALATQA